MLKKIFALGLGVCCLFIFNQADAWEYDKKAIMKEFHCKSGDALSYAENNATGSVTKVNRVYEDDTVKVQTLIGLGFDNLILDSGTRKRLAESDTIIFPVAGNGLLGFNTSILVAPCVIFNITNKTNEPLELDLNRSQISLCNYQGRGVQQGTKYNGAATSEQPPVMIFPKATKEVTLWRTDHQFHDGYYFQGQALVPAKWMPPFDAVPNKNLLGDMMLCINKKYITFSPEAVIPIDSLRWIKGRPSSYQKNIMDAGNYITVQPLKP